MNLWIKTVMTLVLALLPAIPAHADAPKKDRRYYESTGEVVWEVPTEEKVVALTFDDGPDPDNTGQILDLLKMYEAKATFFLIGEKVKRNPELVRREYEEGHELANHTYHHIFLSNRSFGKLEKEIMETEKVIYNATGQLPMLFRPPAACTTTGWCLWPDSMAMWWCCGPGIRIRGIGAGPAWAKSSARCWITWKTGTLCCSMNTSKAVRKPSKP